MADQHPFASIVPLPERWLRVITWVAFAAPFAVYWYYTLRYGPNVPFEDDCDNVLGFVNRWITAVGPWAKLRTVYERSNDHRLITEKLAILLQYGVFGHVNFRHLMILSSVGWTAALVLLLRRARQVLWLGLPWLVPLPCIWFSFVQERGLMGIGAGAIQHHWSIFLALLTLSLLVRNHTRGATATAVLALCTAGVGQVLAPVGSCMLILRRRWRSWALFGSVTGVAAQLAHVSYSGVMYHPSPRDALASFESTVEFFFRVRGSLVHAPSIEIPLGVLCAAGLLHGVITGRGSPFFRSAACYVIVVAAVLALVRAPFNEVPIASRYTIISLLAWSVLYVLWIDGERFKVYGGRALLVVWLVAGAYFGGIVLKANANQTFARNYAARVASLADLVPGHTTAGLSVFQPSPSYAEEVLVRARDTGVFDYRTANRLARVDPMQAGTLQATREYRGYIDGYDGQHLVGWAAIVGVRSSDARIFALLESGGQVYRIPSFPMKRPDVSQSLGTQFGYDWDGFEAFLAAYEIPVGSYRVGIQVESIAGSAVKWTELHYERRAHEGA